MMMVERDMMSEGDMFPVPRPRARAGETSDRADRTDVADRASS
jgi:hypothetical protein